MGLGDGGRVPPARKLPRCRGGWQAVAMRSADGRRRTGDLRRICSAGAPSGSGGGWDRGIGGTIKRQILRDSVAQRGCRFSDRGVGMRIRNEAREPVAHGAKHPGGRNRPGGDAEQCVCKLAYFISAGVGGIPGRSKDASGTLDQVLAGNRAGTLVVPGVSDTLQPVLEPFGLQAEGLRKAIELTGVTSSSGSIQRITRSSVPCFWSTP
jgi:hypothetical protein